MIINIDNQCSIFFGDTTTCPVGYKQEEQFRNFCTTTLRKNLNISNLILPYQVHGAYGWNITDVNQLSSPVMIREREGDFLITNQPDVGIGVLTADCLPIIFYAPKKNIIAVAHGGW